MKNLNGAILLICISFLILALPQNVDAKKKQNENYYQKLGIENSPHTTARDIKKAYFQKAMIYHPDKTALPKDVAEKKFAELAYAYKVLSDSETRAEYDRLLQFGQTELKEAAHGTPKQNNEDEDEEPSYDVMEARRMYEAFMETEKEITNDSGSKVVALLVTVVAIAGAVGVYMATKTKPVKPKDSDVVLKKLEKRKEEEQKKKEEQAKQQEQVKQQQQKKPVVVKEEKEYVEQDWNKIDDSELELIEQSLEIEDKETGEFYCDLCDKSFKTSSQLTQHEKSKKHLQLLKEVNKLEKRQNKGKEDNNKVQDNEEEEVEEEEDEEVVEMKNKDKRNKKALRKQKKKQAFEDSLLDESNLEE